MEAIVRPQDIDLDIELLTDTGAPLNITGADDIQVVVEATSKAVVQYFKFGNGVTVVDAALGLINVKIDRDNLESLRVNDRLSVKVTLVEPNQTGFADGDKYSSVILRDFAKIV